jgi:cell wall-associated NlpC family hydrolase
MGVPVVAEHAAGSGGGAGGFDPASLGLPDPSNGYPGDNAPKYEIAAWMARQAHLAGLPAELPIMAALTESSLHNDNYGDRDSLGYFQMRTSIWNQGQYAGFADHPELQLKWFINEALSVRKERIAQGDTTYGQDRSKWGDWVADVEQPAAEYRGRYQTHLDEADGLLQQASASGGAGIQPAAGSASAAAGIDPTQVGGGVGAGVAAGGSPAGLAALTVAEKYLGTPYQWGGDTPQTGFDCSGLMEWSYNQIGIHLPRVAADQFHVGIPVTKAELKPGDLVFFQDSTGYIHHVGMYIGDDKFIEAPHTGADVRISSLDDPYYAQQFAGGRDMSGLAHGAIPEPTTPPATGTPAPPATPPPDPSQTPATNDPGTSNTGIFGVPAAQPASPKPPGSTVQVLPAVPDPNAPKD